MKLSRMVQLLTPQSRKLAAELHISIRDEVELIVAPFDGAELVSLRSLASQPVDSPWDVLKDRRSAGVSSPGPSAQVAPSPSTAEWRSVSAIIPAFNAEKTIEGALRSALAQTLAPLEIIVVDDGSLDRTCEIVERVEGPITLLRQANAGPAAARNRGARHARGYWLGLLDADDNWATTKLARQLAERPADTVAVVHCLSNTSPPNIPERMTFQELWEKNWIINSSVLVRRDVYEAVGGMDEEIRNTQDYHLWLRLAGLGWEFSLLREDLVFYRTGSGISHNPERLFRGLELTLAKIQDEFRIPSKAVRRRRVRGLEEAVAGAVHHRKLSFARRASREAAYLSPTPLNVAKLLTSHLPKRVLDLKREIFSMFL